MKFGREPAEQVNMSLYDFLSCRTMGGFSTPPDRETEAQMTDTETTNHSDDPPPPPPPPAPATAPPATTTGPPPPPPPP